MNFRAFVGVTEEFVGNDLISLGHLVFPMVVDPFLWFLGSFRDFGG
jgi:hypothetical protein